MKMVYYIKDEGWPFKIILQVRVLNHPEVLLSKEAVLSVREKVGINWLDTCCGDERE